MNANLQKGLKYSVVAGSVVIAVGSVIDLTKSKGEIKKMIMPIVTTLVAVSAFSYAMSNQEVTLVPKG